MRGFFLALALIMPAAAAHPSADDAMPAPSLTVAGDAAQGRAIVTTRQRGLCLLCHSGPFPEEPFQGNLAPSLEGVGRRLSPDQIRLRLADPQRLNPDTIMPSYARQSGFTRPAPAFANRPILTPQEIEDVVAFLSTLR